MTASNAIGKLREIIETEGDPKDVLIKSIGDLSDVKVLHCQVLVATHPGSKYHPGTRLLRTDKDLAEQRFQGSVGLVLKVGPGAFQDSGPTKFYGETVGPGDWVLVRPADGLETFIQQVPCRLFEDVSIKMKIDDPARFW